MKRYARIRNASGGSSWVELTDGIGLAMADAPWLGGACTGELVPLAGAERACPVAPSKIICVGRNYAAHAKELGNEVPKEPLLFGKPPSSLVGPGARVELPAESERVEHEVELAAVIGKRGRRIAPERALDHVFGYTIACDVTARDLQRKDNQWTRAKGFDTFCPTGPEIVCGLDPSELGVRLAVNGAMRQNGNTRDMMYDVARLVAFISDVMTLEPGDLILTGTPEGVGPLVPGDRVHLEIDGIAPLEFDVAAEPNPR